MAIYLNPTDTTPTSIKGGLYYDASESQMKHYNGSSWVNVNTTLNTDRPGDGQYTSDAFTSLLIHSNTSNGSTTFTDSGNNTHVLTGNGGIVHSTGQTKIGLTSMFFDGTDNTITTPDHADWDLSTSTSSPFTIDCWVWHDSSHTSTAAGIVRARSLSSPPGAAGWELKYNGTNLIWFDTDISSELIVQAVELDSAWNHVAIVKEGSGSNAFKMYINGVKVAQATHNAEIDRNGSTEELTIGAEVNEGSSNFWPGYIDELRISKGIARWTANFTVY